MLCTESRCISDREIARCASYRTFRIPAHEARLRDTGAGAHGTGIRDRHPGLYTPGEFRYRALSGDCGAARITRPARQAVSGVLPADFYRGF